MKKRSFNLTDREMEILKAISRQITFNNKECAATGLRYLLHLVEQGGLNELFKNEDKSISKLG